jgi:hypothetical protein
MKTTGIIIGVGAPNDSVKHGKTMCAIVLTADLGFIRIYPVPAEMSFPVLGEVSLHIEKGNDPRAESYRLIRFSVVGKIEDPAAKREILDACVIKSGLDDPLKYQNSKRASIALIKPAWGDCEFSISQKIPKNIPDDDEECGWIVTQGRHWQKPYVTWVSAQGGEHKSHLGGREIYECIRRNPDSVWNLMNNIRVTDPDYEFWMLMGNMKDRMNVWLCVHLHRLKKTSGTVRALFPHPIISGGGWPYRNQECQNTRMADGQPLLFDTSSL